MLDLPRRHGAAEDGAFAVEQLFLKHLVAAKSVAPHRSGNVAPKGNVVQMYVEAGTESDKRDWDIRFTRVFRFQAGRWLPRECLRSRIHDEFYHQGVRGTELRRKGIIRKTISLKTAFQVHRAL